MKMRSRDDAGIIAISECINKINQLVVDGVYVTEEGWRQLLNQINKRDSPVS